MDLLQYTATLPVSSWQWISFNTLPQCLGTVESGSPLAHYHTAREQWAVGLLQYTTTLRGSKWQWISFGTL